MFGCVVKVLDPSDPRYHSDKAKAAIEKELNALRERQVADFSKVREWSDVKAQGGDDELVGFKVIVGIKHYEESEDQHIYKARGCATGNWVQDVYGHQLFEDDMYGRPVAMVGARIAIAETLLDGGDCDQADANNAYCQAKLGPAEMALATKASMAERMVWNDRTSRAARQSAIRAGTC